MDDTIQRCRSITHSTGGKIKLSLGKNILNTIKYTMNHELYQDNF